MHLPCLRDKHQESGGEVFVTRRAQKGGISLRTGRALRGGIEHFILSSCWLGVLSAFAKSYLACL